MSDTYSQALAAWKSGRQADAIVGALTSWERDRDVRAAVLLAVIELDKGCPENALCWTEQAIVCDPSDPRLYLQASRLLSSLGRSPEALESIEKAIGVAPAFGPAWLAFGNALRATGQESQAINAWRRALAFPAQREDALQAIVDTIPLIPGRSSAITAVCAEPVPISIITCSVDDARYFRVHTTYSAALAGWPYEIIRISDARSLAEGYARGLAAARNPIAIFTHDDVELLSADFPSTLARHLSHCDIVGVAGAERAMGPSWVHAGHPWLHGLVILPHRNGYEINLFSERGPLIPEIRMLDGVFLAMHRNVANCIGWDAATFTRFHGYDIDFTLRAAKAGYRLAVATDLGLLHYSKGHYDEEWAQEAVKLTTKHPDLTAAPTIAVRGVGRVVGDALSVQAFMAGWRRFQRNDDGVELRQR